MSDAPAERARTEAAAWFARLSKLSVNAQTLREFQHWKRDKANAAAYAQVEATWAAADALSDDPDLRAATEAALHRTSQARASSPRSRRLSLAVGATALAGAGALSAWLVVASMPTYRTTIGEQRLVILSDGTRLRLNTDSAVKVRFHPGKRDVELQRGEAFFEVAHDAARPFIVASDDARVRAVGTKFDVRRQAETVQVTLLEGRVEVGRDGATATLAPNQQLTVSRQGLSAPSATNAAEASSWTSGRLTFRGVALADAVAEVNRYARRKVVLDAPATLAQQPVSGVFNTGDTTAFVAAVDALFDLQSTPRPGGEVRLSPRTAAPGA